MKRTLAYAIVAALAAQVLAVDRRAQAALPAPTTFALPNGLSVVVDEDASVADVAVELWVRAGSRYEDPERWGQAHFFEHMFAATRLPPAPGRVLGGNAQTRRDFCRYYLLVDPEAVEYAIAAQADRLDYPLAAMTEQRLAANRDIVINEFRGYESRPYGFGSITDVKTLTNGFGSGHPYARPIQLNQDVPKISDADMQRWIADRYRPSESILIIAGHTTVARVRPLVEHYFGPIPAVRDAAAHPVARVTVEPLEPTAERHERLDVAAPASRVFAAWATPRYGDPDADYLSLFVEVLSAPEASRLHRRLVVGDRLADSVSADTQIEELAGLIRATVMLRPGVDSERAAAVVADTANALADSGPTGAELRTAKARLAARAARQWERLGFQGSRIDLVGEGALYVGNAAAYRARLDRIAAATPTDVARAAQVWVKRHGYFLTATSGAAASASAPIDRAQPVTLAAAPARSFPSVTATRLPNGVRLATVERPESPLVDIAVVIPVAGDASAARMSADALTDRDPANRSRRADALRACIDEGAAIEGSGGGGSVIITIDEPAAGATTALRAAAALLSDEPVDAGAVTRAREREASRSASQDAPARARATLTRLLAGRSATAGADTAHVVVAASGAFDRSTLSAAFTALPSVHAAPIESTHSAPSERAAAAGVYVVDEPGRTQTVITAGHILAPNAAASLVRARLAVGILGSRVYDDLRTQHQWAYEAQAALSWSDDAAPAIVIATEVVTDHAADAVAEIRRECGRPAAAAELGRLAIFRRDLVQQIVGGADSVAGVTAVLADLSRRGLPATAAGDLLQDAANLDEARVADALRLLNGDALTFVLAGDAQTLMPRLKAAGIGGILVSR